MNKKYTIGFIFLDEIHHLFHFLSVAIELSKTHDVRILTFPAKHELLYNTLKKFSENNVKVEELSTLAFRAFTDKIKKRRLPKKLFWMQKNQRHILKDFDAIVFTDYFHHYFLKKRKEKNLPKFIYIPHGVAGRAYAYKKDIEDYDFNLLFGKFHLQQLNEKNVKLKDVAVVGYPKLDLIDLSEKESFFKNKKTTVLYNPHFSKPLSSWYHIGLSVLEFFYNHEDYNLIFAPHINLFHKKGRENASMIPQKYFKADNIHIDLGSINSVNMTYVKTADIYLGDASSLVYEFILNPRPCIFLNMEKVDFRDNPDFRFWKCGEVIEELAGLEVALKNVRENFESYKPIQQEITAGNFFSEENSTASERAANAIVSYLNKTV